MFKLRPEMKTGRKIYRNIALALLALLCVTSMVHEVVWLLRLNAGESVRPSSLLLFAFITLVTFALIVWQVVMLVKASDSSEMEKAREASRMKSMFVQNISHDIRTPLNAIVGYSRLLAMPDMYLSDEEKAEFCEYMLDSADMLTMLVDDILELSDIENDVVQINLGECSCNEICNKCVQSSRMRVVPGVKMHWTSEVELGYTFVTDRRRVQQIITNFLSNACKHTTEGEIHLHCSLSENPGSVTFSVADTGTGVDEEIKQDIFERFSSADRIIGGHGLGLNICRNLSRRLGGDVWLDTSYTKGARFCLILPLKKGE